MAFHAELHEIFIPNETEKVKVIVCLYIPATDIPVFTFCLQDQYNRFMH